MVKQADGTSVAYTRATTMAGALEDLNGLISWKQAITAIGMTRSKALQASMSFLSYDDDKTKVKNLVEKAFVLGGGEDKADLGTAFHNLVEMYHNGIEPNPGVQFPDGFGEAFEAYKAFIEQYGMQVAGSEVTIVEDSNRVAGTADLIVTFDKDITTPFGVITAGHGIIADVKTGSVSDYSGMKMGMQLAAYSHGKPYHAGREERVDWPVHMESWVGLILKVDLETGAVIPWWLDLRAAFAMLPVAVQVREFRKDGRRMITQADPIVGEVAGKPKAKRAPRKKKAEPETPQPDPQPVEQVTEPKAPVPLEVVNIEDVAPAPAEPEEPAEPAEPEVKPYSVEDATLKASQVKNLGELRELFKEFEKARRRGQSTAEAVAIISAKSAELK